MPCAHIFRSTQRLAGFCTIQDDSDASVPEGSVHCPYVFAPTPSFADAKDSHVLWARHALLCRVGHKEKHSRPVKQSAGPGREGSELDSILTSAGAPPSTS